MTKTDRTKETANSLLKAAAAFAAGVREFRLSCTTRYSTEDLRDAYDWGREWAHRLTLRRYES